MSKILDGKKLSQLLALKLAKKVKKLAVKPKLVIIQIGDLAESNTYIKNKKAFAEKIGAVALHKKYQNTIKESQVILDILRCNRDRSVHGIMVQLPAPKHFDIERVLESIDPKKDVDGLTAINTKHLFDNNEAFIPATAKGIIGLLEEYKIKLAGTKIVIVGQSSLVGRPAMLALLNKNATVTMCHKDTRGLTKETKRADILITAVGQPKLITRKHVSKNQIVVDIGINIVRSNPTSLKLRGAKKIVGDVDYEKVRKIVKAITPVPGGVGPMTVASLFQNLFEAYSLQT
ncbi:MAG: bifunctional 5,10-methylenetetrahydrofolate dehydrogenase/5,10-methenyltetrahydrofolate cyclohydrolase [bacterium]|nr:bifunctional 5,10-methylenetetrahydrofolate dehydrogenase/5,10-methenyltetrahydrofolate cyclohydrolase [bacterium]MDZ4206053.1 bifunctional 5,10-methylenetetrahydrofolate dehydrogenase/5,10-methenyltetrahydrofolate cyclohydrolase [Patescibacteria group bacterium]